MKPRRKLYNPDWIERPLPASWWSIQKAKAEDRMAAQDAMIEAGMGLRGRLSVDMVRAGPLKTDEWVQPPQIRGIGRRLGNLTSSELEAQEYGRWS